MISVYVQLISMTVLLRIRVTVKSLIPLERDSMMSTKWRVVKVSRRTKAARPWLLKCIVFLDGQVHEPSTSACVSEDVKSDDCDRGIEQYTRHCAY